MEFFTILASKLCEKVRIFEKAAYTNKKIRKLSKRY